VSADTGAGSTNKGAAAHPRGAQSRPLRILVAEDNAVNIKLMRATLGSLGYAADYAHDGFEVLEAMRAQTYDLIFMDVRMPGLDGIETTRRIRTAGAGRPRPHIVALTASDLPSERSACAAAGIDDFLVKPAARAQIVAVLEHCAGAR